MEDARARHKIPEGISKFSSLEPIGAGDLNVLLMYARDDTTFGEHEKNWREVIKKEHLTVKTEKFGGHRIFDSYAGYIDDFVKYLQE